MASIGDYSDRIAILPRVLATGDTRGQRLETWPEPDPAQPWAAALERLSGNETIAASVRQSNATIRLRLPGQAPVANVDRIRLESTGDVYAIDDATFDRIAWETVLTCSLPKVA